MNNSMEGIPIDILERFQGVLTSNAPKEIQPFLAFLRDPDNSYLVQNFFQKHHTISEIPTLETRTCKKPTSPDMPKKEIIFQCGCVKRISHDDHEIFSPCGNNVCEFFPKD